MQTISNIWLSGVLYYTHTTLVSSQYIPAFSGNFAVTMLWMASFWADWFIAIFSLPMVKTNALTVRVTSEMTIKIISRFAVFCAVDPIVIRITFNLDLVLEKCIFTIVLFLVSLRSKSWGYSRSSEVISEVNWGQIRRWKWKQAFISFHWFDGWSQFWTVCFSISWSDPPTSSSHASISSRYDILIISLLFQLIKLIYLSYLFSLFSLFGTYTVPFWVITRVSAFFMRLDNFGEDGL